MASKKTNGSSSKRTYVYKKHPLLVFLLLIVLLFAVIYTLFQLREPTTQLPEDKPIKKVNVFIRNKPIKLTLQARVNNGNSLTLYSQASGIITNVSVFEGQNISPGATIASISQNYMGGNSATLQRQIAERQLDNSNDTYQTQIDLINLQREIAEKVDDNTDQLREISERSIGETRELISINQEILDTLEQNLEFLQQNDQSGENSDTILNIKQAISGIKTGQLQLRSSLRNLNYQTSDDNPPAELSDRQRNVTILGLDLQEKGLKLSRELTQLQLKLAMTGESIYFPQSPVGGTVEKIYVTKNRPVTLGTPIAVVSTPKDQISLSTLIPEGFANLIKSGATANVIYKEKTIPADIIYVSDIPVQGSLFSLNLSMNENDLATTQGQFIEIELISSVNCQKNRICLIPVSAVTQSQNETSVLVVENGIAKKRVVRTGDITGKYIELIEGVDRIDQIITDRNVIEGDKITIN